VYLGQVPTLLCCGTGCMSNCQNCIERVTMTPTLIAEILADATEPALPAKAKKRKRAPKQPKVAAEPSAQSEPPLNILIIDNGGDTVKYGWNTESKPRSISNVTARLQQQWTVLVGDQLATIQNLNQLVGVTRSTERGIPCNLGNQIQVWKRILDILNVSVPLTTETAQAFNWKLTNTVKLKSSVSETTKGVPILPATCGVLIALPPFCPRSVLDQIMLIWMEDFGFHHVGFCISTVCASQPHADYQTSCAVDLGWSATHIVPMFQGRPIERAIKRIPLAGRHLINMWKYCVRVQAN
jgi:actin-related protein